MSNIKCPFCQQELEEGWLVEKRVVSELFKCCKCEISGNKKLWQELIRTRKALEIAKTHLGYIKNNYHSWTPYRDEQMIAQASNCLAKIQELEDDNL